MEGIKLMNSNIIILIVVFAIILLVLRGYMGLTIRLVLNKKERKHYQTSYSLLSRWFFWSTHKVIKDIKNKYEKRTIRYKAIMMIYKHMTIILHFELFALLILCLLTYMNDDGVRIFNAGCWIYTISVACCFIVLAGCEFYSNRRYHRNRYR